MPAPTTTTDRGPPSKRSTPTIAHLHLSFLQGWTASAETSCAVRTTGASGFVAARQRGVVFGRELDHQRQPLAPVVQIEGRDLGHLAQPVPHGVLVDAEPLSRFHRVTLRLQPGA